MRRARTIAAISKAAEHLPLAERERTIWIADAHRDDGRRFIVQADEKLSAFVELERQVLTVKFYLESIRAGDALLGLSLP